MPRCIALNGIGARCSFFKKPSLIVLKVTCTDSYIITSMIGFSEKNIKYLVYMIVFDDVVIVVDN